MNPQETAEISTETPPARNVGSIPITRSTSQDATPAGKPGKTWEVEHGGADSPAHDSWKNHFILPLASFMQKRGCQSVFVTVRDGQVGYEVTPVGEAPLIYELVDATDQEQYFPLGLFTNLATALREAGAHHPGCWEPIMNQSAFAEIRARKVGTSGGDYTVLWRGEWFYDYEAHEWKLVEQQTGTLENPLPITRA